MNALQLNATGRCMIAWLQLSTVMDGTELRRQLNTCTAHMLQFNIKFPHHSEFLIRIIHPPLSDLHLNMPV